MTVLSLIFAGQWTQVEINIGYLISYLLFAYVFETDGFDALEVAVFSAIIFSQMAFNWAARKNKRGAKNDRP